jgi:DNA-binding transcriptional MerR regulator
MPDYYLSEHLAAKLGLSLEELLRYEAQGVIKRIVRKGRTYYSSQDAYRLRGVLDLMRKKGLDLEEARARVRPVVSVYGSAQ